VTTATDTMSTASAPKIPAPAPTHVSETPTEAGRTVTHGMFVLERTYRQSPQTVFDAWASRDAKNAWFGEGDDFVTRVDRYDLDFRVGGHEYLDGPLPSGHRFEYDSTYGDIVPGRRIVAMYDVLIDGRRISVSLLTVEFEPAGSGTHLVMTEQGAFLDGIDTNDERIKGADDSLDQLTKYLDAH
jgi:uncharacterized protein YndB with AHSA1/START domain